MVRRISLCIVIIMLLYGSHVCAAEWFSDFDKNDLMWQAGSTFVTVLDWGTTLDIVDRPDEFHETNWYLGEHPSRGKVNKYFAIVIAANWGIAWALPTDAEILNYHVKPRRWFQYVWVGAETAVVAHNLSIGLRFNF